MKRLIFTAALVFAALGSTAAFAGGGTGITATPASTQQFDSGACSAQFVRSASGIINETNRSCPFFGIDGSLVAIQFRPVSGTPNPACDPNGLVVAPFQYSNVDPAIGGSKTGGYFIVGASYNVCAYLVNPQVASGTVDSADPSGSTASLPSGLSGRFRIDVSGTWNNTSHGYVDAEYNNGDNEADITAGWPQDGWPNLGADFGDLFVDGAAVNWGAYSASHAYSTTLSTGSPINLAVFDGDASNPSSPVVNPGWYGDNVGSLSYTVTYLGL